MGRGALSIAKFCTYASVGRTTVFGEIKAGRLIAHKCGRSTVILIEDADVWLQSLPQIHPLALDTTKSDALTSSAEKGEVPLDRAAGALRSRRILPQGQMTQTPEPPQQRPDPRNQPLSIERRRTRLTRPQ